MVAAYPDRIDFVVPTVEMALDCIAKGATNGRELLEAAGLTQAEADAELAGADHPESDSARCG